MCLLRNKFVLLGGGTLTLWTAKEWIDECSTTRQISLPLLLWKSLPARTGTILWGRLSRMTLPAFAREPVYRLYSKIYDCNLNELPEDMNLRGFASINEFFTRKLARNSRPLSSAEVVSCCDGTVVECGTLSKSNGYRINSPIKGISLSASQLVGTEVKPRNPSNELFYYVLYLGPGDYHRFHAPFDVSFDRVGHFNGELFPVKPSFIKRISNIFIVNERIALQGEWKHGYVAYCPIGALGVGNIVLNRLDAQTIAPDLTRKSLTRSRGWQSGTLAGINFGRGTEVGRFEMGSTVVVIFEAPASFSWTFMRPKVKVGEAIGSCKNI